MRSALLVLAALALVLPGCVTPLTSGGLDGDVLAVAPTAGAGPLALLRADDADGNPLWYGSTGLDGAFRAPFGDGVARVLLWTQDGRAFEVAPDGSLAAAGDFVAPFAPSARVAFPNPSFPVQLGTTCAEKTDGDVGCGLDEPSVVVDARGWIYYTAACCFFVSSPVFVSKDGGATFENLAHPMKDFYGNEGDLAVDDAGNLYYADIDLATFGIARWNPDLSPAYGYRRPGEPLVDRPWIRAGAEGVVHLVYNTGGDTVYYRSTDHAMTFTTQPTARFGSALAGAYSDVRRGIVGMIASGDYMESADAGATWGERVAIGGCAGAPASFYQKEMAAVDEAGTVWFSRDGCVTGRLPDGTWTKDARAVPEGFEIFFSWIAAGAPGAVAFAGYARASDAAAAEAAGLDPDAWYTFASWSVDADAESPHWATTLLDADPVGFGDLGRRLGDFMMVAIGPEGSLHVAYAMNPEMDDSATATYRSLGPIPGLAPSVPLAGPYEA